MSIESILSPAIIASNFLYWFIVFLVAIWVIWFVVNAGKSIWDHFFGG